MPEIVQRKRKSFHRWVKGNTCINCGVSRSQTKGVFYYSVENKSLFKRPFCTHKKNLTERNNEEAVEKDYEYDVPMIDEVNIEIEKRYCTFFGCGNRLSLIETLCGDFCEKHFDYKKPVYFNGLL